jgi:small redox-active disulfide protein 2
MAHSWEFKMKKFQILGMGCKKCVLLTANAEAAAKALGIDYEVEKITDVGKITEMGVMMTPALAIDGEVVLSGKTSSPEEIKTILERRK